MLVSHLPLNASVLIISSAPTEHSIMADTAPVNKKLCVIGDGATGKTSLLYRMKNNLFDEKYVPTIFETENMSCEFDGKKVNLR